MKTSTLPSCVLVSISQYVYNKSSYVSKRHFVLVPKVSCTELTVSQSNSKGSISSRRKNGTFIYPLIILTVQNGIRPDSNVVLLPC